MYVRIGAANSQANLRAYLGGRAFNPIYEMGYDFSGLTEYTGLNLYLSYLAAHGDPIEKYGGLKQALFGWRAGIDMRFKTPCGNLNVYAGMNLNWWDGIRVTPGSIPNYDNPRSPFPIRAGEWPEGQAKFGMRLGVEYRFNEKWGVSLDGNTGAWLSMSTINGVQPISGQRNVRGVNPVAPTWIALSAQYRYNLW
jgi:hypothetical protein